MNQEKIIALIELLEEKDKFGNNPRYYRLLAQTYMELRDVLNISKDKAIEAANKCIELESKNSDWHRLLGFVHYWFGDIEIAIHHTEEALRIAGEDAAKVLKSKNNLAFYYAATEDKKYKQQALTYAREICEFEESIPHLDTAGYVKMKFAENRGDLEEASNLFNRALQKTPTDQTVLTHLVEAYQRMKKLYS